MHLRIKNRKHRTHIRDVIGYLNLSSSRTTVRVPRGVWCMWANGTFDRPLPRPSPCVFSRPGINRVTTFLLLNLCNQQKEYYSLPWLIGRTCKMGVRMFKGVMKFYDPKQCVRYIWLIVGYVGNFLKTKLNKYLWVNLDINLLLFVLRNLENT